MKKFKGYSNRIIFIFVQLIWNEHGTNAEKTPEKNWAKSAVNDYDIANDDAIHSDIAVALRKQQWKKYE